MKRILGILIVLAMTLSLLGCTNSNRDLYNALEKMQNLTQVERQRELSFQVEGQGFGEEEQMKVDQLALSLSNLKLLSVEKFIGNEEQTQAKSEATTSISFGGMTIDGKTWSDLDLEKGHMKNIIQLPAMLSGLVGIEGDKDYLVYDLRKSMEVEDEEINFDQMIKFRKEFQGRTLELVEEIQKELQADFKIISLKEEKERAGEKIKVYELKLDDESFKKLVEEFVNTRLDDKESKDFIVDYMNPFMKTLPSKDFNKFMEKIQDIKILGEKGLSVEYLVNTDGYIIESNGLIDLDLDFEKLAKVSEKLPANKGILKLTINYNTKNKNINNQDIKVEFPEINQRNSVDLLEVMEEQINRVELP